MDIKHTEMLAELDHNDTVVIPQLEAELAQMKVRSKTETLTIEEYALLKYDIQKMKRKLKELKEKRTQYYLDNSKYIFEFFNQRMLKQTNGNAVPSNSKKRNKLMEMFHLNTEEDAAQENALKEKQQMNVVGGNVAEMTTATLFQKYMANIDKNSLDIQFYCQESELCPTCYRGELVPVDDDGMLICNKCSAGIPYLIDNEKPSYKDPPKEITVYAYKRINHFKEIIAQFQGKETANIEPEEMERIKKQIKKERLELPELNYYVVKEILKKLKLNHHYEHIHYIKNLLGIPPPVFTAQFEETLMNLFIEIQAPYAKTAAKKKRINFLTYHYVLFKFCELLGETQYLHEIPMLKDIAKIAEQDDSWKDICDDLNWVYIPTAVNTNYALQLRTTPSSTAHDMVTGVSTQVDTFNQNVRATLRTTSTVEDFMAAMFKHARPATTTTSPLTNSTPTNSTHVTS